MSRISHKSAGKIIVAGRSPVVGEEIERATMARLLASNARGPELIRQFVITEVGR
jgi:hypothetical protein